MRGVEPAGDFAVGASPRFAVVGAGAIGGYYGSKLARGGCDVRFLLRSDLGVVQREGFSIREGKNTAWQVPVQAFASTVEIGPVDVVLIALKTTSNAELLHLLPPLLRDDTVLVTLQNGLGNEEFLAQHFGAGRVIGGVCFVCLNRVAPGAIEHYGHGAVSLGEFGRPRSARIDELVATFTRCGVNTKAVENVADERWRKLVWNIPFNGLSIAAGAVTVEDILREPRLRQLALDLMGEVIAIAAAEGHTIEAGFADYQLARSESMGPYKPSSLLDYAAGRAVEVESIWGEPQRRGAVRGVQGPRLGMLHTLLQSMVDQRLSRTMDL